jgi:glycosyltransferase involved in cell wall biosynthesis
MGERALNIVMPIFRFPPILGGAEVQAFRLATALRQRGANVTIVTARFSGLAAWETMSGVPVHRVFCPSDANDATRLGLYAFMLSLAWFLVSQASLYEIVHSHQAMFAAALSTAIGRRLGKRTIVKFGGMGANSDFVHLSRLRFGSSMMREIKRADAAVATSTAIQQDLDYYGFRKEQVIHIPNGIDTRAFSPLHPKQQARAALGIPGDARLVLFVGNLRPVKGVDILIDAWPHVISRCPEARLVIVGDGPKRVEWQARVAELGLADSVRFVGAQADPREFYWAADIFVLPSRSEGLPNVILEALSAGLPCVASRVGGIVDQVKPGENGWLVPPEDSTELAKALALLLQEDLEMWSWRARESAKRYDWDVIAPQYLALYHQLLGLDA